MDSLQIVLVLYIVVVFCRYGLPPIWRAACRLEKWARIDSGDNDEDCYLTGVRIQANGLVVPLRKHGHYGFLNYEFTVPMELIDPEGCKHYQQEI